MVDIVNPGQPAALLNNVAMPANVDLVLYKGDYVDIRVTLRLENPDEPMDLTNLVPSAQLRENYDSLMGIDFQCTLTGDAGEVRIFMPSSTTSALTAGSYIWDFQLTDSSGNSRTYFAGDVTVSREVTA